MAFIDDLKTRRNAIGVELAALSATAAGGLPDASGPNAVGHVNYRLSLYKELEWIKEQIADFYETEALENGPTEIVTEGYT